MTDLVQKGCQWLEDQRVKHMARPVLYQRGESVVELPATIGRTVFELDTGTGVLERFEARDYLVLAADLVLDAEVTLPKAGDRIRETADSQVFVYEVMAPGKEPVWRYSDPYRKTLRIHTKQVDMEAV